MGEYLNPLRAENLALLMRRAPIRRIPTTGWTETKVGTGGGTSSQNPSYIVVNTGATADSSDLMYAGITGLECDGALVARNRINWDKKLYWGFGLSRQTDNALLVCRVQLKAVNTIGALAEDGLGVQISNLALVGESYGASGATTGTLTMTANASYNMVVILTPGVKIEWLSNNVLLGTQATAAKIPSGESSAAINICLSILSGNPGADGYCFVMNPWFWQAQ